jgi:histidine ammonia-lyase
MATVTITEAPLAIEDLLAVVDGARVELDGGTRGRIAAGRAVVDRALAGGVAVYGLTTQVGHGKDTRLTEEEIQGEQRFLVMSHSGGIGPPLPAAIVRAALAVRLNGIARGGSGASVAAAEMLAAMLNAGVHPVVPETASVGAADIGQMAGMAQVAIGMGRAEYRGEVVPGGEALRRAGITPLVLGGKDGLALISANGVSVGQAALVAARAAAVAEAADVAAALSMEATGANVSILQPAVGRAKPIPGQIAAADHLRALLAGSPLLEPGGARSVQDALSFRVVPQVHGALREYVTAARSAVTAELNAAADNPLVSVPDQDLISNGNFQPVVLAIAHDALRIALAQAGQLSERRMSHLWDAFFRQTAGGPPPAVPYGLQLRYPAAARFGELKQLAAPDLGVEDHGTGAPLSVRKADAALGLLEDLLAVELLLARDVLAAAPDRPGLGAGTGAALDTVERAIAHADPYADAVHRALRERFPDRPAGPPRLLSRADLCRRGERRDRRSPGPAAGGRRARGGGDDALTGQGRPAARAWRAARRLRCLRRRRPHPRGIRVRSRRCLSPADGPARPCGRHRCLR